MRFGFRSEMLTLGIDVGSFSLKVVRLLGKSPGLKTATAASSRFSGQAPPGEDELVAVLKNVLERNGLAKEQLSLVLPEREANVRFFPMPKMPREELGQAVAWEAAKHASLPSEDLITDFVAFEPTPSLPDGQQQVMAVMMPRETVERWAGKFSRAGLRLAAIDIPAMALLAYVDLHNPWEREGCGALLDLGHSRTGIHLFQNRRLCFTRDVAIGGSDISQALVDVLHIDLEQAEEIKQRLGVAGEGAEGEKVRQIVEQVLERIAVEVQRSFDYYQAQYREASFDAVRLCGGTALLPGCAHYFSEALRLGSSVEQPWQAVPLAAGAQQAGDLTQIGPVFSSAIGLATRRSD